MWRKASTSVVNHDGHHSRLPQHSPFGHDAPCGVHHCMRDWMADGQRRRVRGEERGEVDAQGVALAVRGWQGELEQGSAREQGGSGR